MCSNCKCPVGWCIDTGWWWLQALHPLIQDSDNVATRDNAAGAVGRMLSSMPSQLPLDQVLPVLLSKLPYDFLLRMTHLRHLSDDILPALHLDLVPVQPT